MYRVPGKGWKYEQFVACPNSQLPTSQLPTHFSLHVLYLVDYGVRYCTTIPGLLQYLSRNSVCCGNRSTNTLFDNWVLYHHTSLSFLVEWLKFFALKIKNNLKIYLFCVIICTTLKVKNYAELIHYISCVCIFAEK